MSHLPCFFFLFLLVDPRHWEWLILHTCVLEHVRPLPARACVAVLEMLSEVVCTEKLLRVVALAEFVQIDQMLDPGLPVALRWHFALLPIAKNPHSVPRELIATVAAGVGVFGRGWRDVKCIYVPRECGAGPGMAAQVERVLVPLCFVFVLEAVLAICAFVLLL